MKNTVTETVKEAYMRDFPGSPVVKTPHFHCTLQGAQVLSLVRELRSHMPCSAAKKKKREAYMTGCTQLLTTMPST